MTPRLQLPDAGKARLAPAFLVIFAALVVAPQAVHAQPRPTRPEAIKLYAIQNATIVTVSGQTIDNGTVVVENGIISAVGQNVDILRPPVFIYSSLQVIESP